MPRSIAKHLVEELKAKLAETSPGGPQISKAKLMLVIAALEQLIERNAELERELGRPNRH